MQQKIDAGKEVDRANQKLPEHTACGVGLEGEDEVGDSTDDHGPGKDERHGEARERRNQNGEEASKNQQDAERDGPVNRLGGERGKAWWISAHCWVLQKTYVCEAKGGCAEDTIRGDFAE